MSREALSLYLKLWSRSRRPPGGALISRTSAACQPLRSTAYLPVLRMPGSSMLHLRRETLSSWGVRCDGYIASRPMVRSHQTE